jgi:hypothetical protein
MATEERRRLGRSGKWDSGHNPTITEKRSEHRKTPIDVVTHLKCGGELTLKRITENSWHSSLHLYCARCDMIVELADCKPRGAVCVVTKENE